MKQKDNVIEYLTDVLGYDSDMIDEIYEDSGLAGLKSEILDMDEFRAFTKE